MFASERYRSIDSALRMTSMVAEPFSCPMTVALQQQGLKRVIRRRGSSNRQFLKLWNEGKFKGAPP
jgi:hypothetical protein